MEAVEPGSPTASVDEAGPLQVQRRAQHGEGATALVEHHLVAGPVTGKERMRTVGVVKGSGGGGSGGTALPSTFTSMRPLPGPSSQ